MFADAPEVRIDHFADAQPLERTILPLFLACDVDRQQHTRQRQQREQNPRYHSLSEGRTVARWHETSTRPVADMTTDISIVISPHCEEAWQRLEDFYGTDPSGLICRLGPLFCRW